MEPTNQPQWRRRRFFFFPLLVIGFFIVSAIVMLLWNSIIPSISTLLPLTYWQAMGLFVLSRILFSGFRFRRNHNRMHHHFNNFGFKDRFMNMTEEEKQQFKNQWKKRCC